MSTYTKHGLVTLGWGYAYAMMLLSLMLLFWIDDGNKLAAIISASNLAADIVQVCDSIAEKKGVT